jgi:RHS repeat-associated protein
VEEWSVLSRARLSVLVVLSLLAVGLGWSALASPAGATDDSYSAAVKADSPVSYWRMDDTSDSVGSSPGTVQGTVTQAVPGAISGSTATGFAGAGAMVLPYSSALQPPTAFTIEAWIKTTATVPSGGAYVMRSWACGYELRLIPFGPGNSAIAEGYTYSNGGNSEANSGVAVNDGNWHHLVYTIDTTASHFYLDGQQVGTGAALSANINYCGTSISIGEGSPSDGYFSGSIDEVALYNHALTTAQVQAHYAASRTYSTPPQVMMGTTTMAGTSEDPVETAHGNFHDSYEDLSTPAGVYGMDFTRYYNSLDSTLGPLGRGWRTSDSASLTTDGSGTVNVTLDDGRLVPFVPNGSGGFLVPLEFAGVLASNGNGTYRISFPGGEVWQFDSAGRLASMADSQGQTVSITRDGSGNLSSVSSSTGASLTFAYTAGLLTSVTSSDGRTVGFAFTSGSLTGATDAAGHTTTIGVNASGVVNQITDPTGVVEVTNTYDSAGRVATQATPQGSSTFAYSPSTYTTTVTTSPGGQVVTYHHDSQGRLLSITDPLGNSTGTRTYNAAGFLTGTADRTGVSSGATFDARGNQLTSVDPSTGTTTYTYDSSDRIATTTDPQHGTTTYGYTGNQAIPSTITDAQGHVTAQTVVGEQVTSTIDPDGVTTSYTYDSANRPLTSTDAAGHTTTYTYDGAGRRLSERLPSGATTSWTYDGAGRILTVTAPDTGVTTYGYDAAGRATTVTDPTGAVTTTTYNALGLPASVTPPGKPATTYGYDALGELTSVTQPGQQPTTFTYVALGRVDSMTDPAGNVTHYTYDATGRPAGVTAPDGGTTTKAYDTAGRLASTTVAGAAGSRATTTTYATNGLVDHQTAPDNGVITYGYDSLGRQSSVTDPTGVATTTTYTPGGRVATTTTAATGTTTYTYNNLGQLTDIADALGHHTTYGYDADGHRTTVQTSTGLVTTTAFDPVGRPTVVIAPDGSTVTDTYTLRGELHTTQQSGRGTVTYLYNGDKTLSSVQNATGGTTSFGYDNLSRKTSQTDPSGGVTSWTYDADSRIATETLPQVTGHTLATTTWTYDPNGRVATITDPTGRVTTNTWDQLGDLTADAFSGGGAAAVNHAYTYDNAGRRIGATGTDGTSAWTYDGAGRETSITEPGSRTSTYGYDAAGRLATETAPSGFGVAYTFDAAGRPTAITPTSRLADTFTAPNGTVPDSKSWTTTIASSATGSIQSNALAINTAKKNGSAYTLQSNEPANTSEDLRFNFTITDKTATNRTNVNVWNRSSASGSYQLQITSDSSSATVWRNTTQIGTLTVPNASTVGVRFRVTGSTVAARLWDTSTSEPSTWGYSATDTGVTTAGVGKIQVSRNAGSNTVTLDNVSETDPVAALPVIDTIGYDNDNRITSETLPGGSRTWGYTNGRLTSLNETIPGLTRNTTLTYDTAGAVHSEATSGVTTTYGYDPAGELTSATPSAGSTTTYTYSTSGRRLTQQVGSTTTTYGYDQAGELTTATPSTGTATSYTYDLAGRRSSETTGTTTVTNAYDAAQRLTGITRNANGTVTSQTRTLLPNGLVATSTSAGVTHNYDWDPNQQLQDWQRADVTTQLTNSPSGWAAMTQGGTTTALGIDNYGSVVTASSPTTAVARSASYTAFGAATGSNTFDARLGYRGELTLDTLTNLRAREYQTTAGVFISRDPLAEEAGTPTVGNAYHYTNNDPLDRVDPTGQSSKDPDIDGTDAACQGAGGYRVQWGHTNTMKCLLQPPSHRDGALCRPPTTPSGGLVIYNAKEEACGAWSDAASEFDQFGQNLDDSLLGLGEGLYNDAAGAGRFAACVLKNDACGAMMMSSAYQRGGGGVSGVVAAFNVFDPLSAITKSGQQLVRGAQAGDYRQVGLGAFGFYGGMGLLGESGGEDPDPGAGNVYRTGSRTDAALTDPTGVSFRDSISSSADQIQVFRAGDKIYAVDTSKLPPGSVIRDGVPNGHVSIRATPDQIRAAVVDDPDLSGLGLKKLDDGSYRLPK